MSELKKLAKDTAIYGLSSIVGRFLNWCLVPLYSYVLVDSGEYGIVTNLYAWTALVIVILTYGMETGFFRFANENNEDEKSCNRVYSTTLTSVGFTSALFSILCVLFYKPIAAVMGYAAHPEFIAILGVVVAVDAFDSIVFGYLRYKNKPIVFASLKLLNIFVNIFFNIFFLVVCPKIHESNPSLVDWFYSPAYGVGYVFVANAISTLVVTLTLMPWIFVGRYTFDFSLLCRMLKYSLPLLLLGIAGIMNQTVDKILFPIVYPDKVEGMRQLGIYGACFKVSLVMMMFTNAFRFAYEPFVFAKSGGDKKKSYADAMKFFVITALLILLGMVFYLDILQYVLGAQYRSGLDVVPVVLVTYLIHGVMYNISLWYKLVDKTYFGAIFSLVGLVITVVVNVLFIPQYGYWACAAASLLCYVVMTLLSYFIGQRYYPVDYPWLSIGKYVLLAVVLYLLAVVPTIEMLWLRLIYRTLLLSVFLIYLVRTDLPLSEIPVVKKLVKKQ